MEDRVGDDGGEQLSGAGAGRGQVTSAKCEPEAEGERAGVRRG